MSTPKELSVALDALTKGTLTAEQFVAQPAVMKHNAECRRVLNDFVAHPAVNEKDQPKNPVARIRMAAALDRLEARGKSKQSMSEVAADYWNKRNTQKDSQ